MGGCITAAPSSSSKKTTLSSFISWLTSWNWWSHHCSPKMRHLKRTCKKSYVVGLQKKEKVKRHKWDGDWDGELMGFGCLHWGEYWVILVLMKILFRFLKLFFEFICSHADWLHIIFWPIIIQFKDLTNQKLLLRFFRIFKKILSW